MLVSGFLPTKTGDSFLECFPIQIDVGKFPAHDNVPERDGLLGVLAWQQPVNSSVCSERIVVTVRIVDRVVLEERGSNLLVEDLDISAKGDEDTSVLGFGRKEVRYTFRIKDAASTRMSRRGRTSGMRRRHLQVTWHR
jgi:hypothetical protein